MKKLILVSISTFLFLLSWSQNGKDPVKVTDLLKIKTIGSVTLTKDGSKAAFTVTSIEPEDNSQWEYKYTSQLWMVSTEAPGAMPRQLTDLVKKELRNLHGALMESNWLL